MIKANIVSLLEEASELTENDPVIAGQLGREWKNLGKGEEAIQLLKDVLESNRTESRVREILIYLLEKNKNFEDAYDLAADGASVDPTFWRMQRHIARLGQKLGKSVETVEGHYRAALRHNKGDVTLIVELASYLFMQGRYQEAEKAFSESKGMSLSGREKSKIRVWWKDNLEKNKVFNGRIKRISGAIAILESIPENIESKLWRTLARMEDLKVGDKVSYHIGFNAGGPSAKLLL